MKGYYEDFCGFGRRKNKANSKPIHRPLAGNPKHEAINPKRVEKVRFEKTKPILKWTK
jgi:hypothetical protein